VVFIESKAFTRRLQELAKNDTDRVLSEIQRSLIRNPARGAVVKGLGEIRKARTSDPGRGKGKRGGFRYMYLYLEHRDHIHLLFLFAKNEQEDLDTAQRASLRGLVKDIKE
jgi:hypothetical protein